MQASQEDLLPEDYALLEKFLKHPELLEWSMWLRLNKRFSSVKASSRKMDGLSPIARKAKAKFDALHEAEHHSRFQLQLFEASKKERLRESEKKTLARNYAWMRGYDITRPETMNILDFQLSLLKPKNNHQLKF